MDGTLNFVLSCVLLFACLIGIHADKALDWTVFRSLTVYDRAGSEYLSIMSTNSS